MAKHDNIPEFPGYYVSKRGRVFSRIQLLPAKDRKGNSRVYSNEWHELKPYLKKGKGKYQITLYKPNDRSIYTKMVHKLVAKIYVPNPNNYPFVCHIDDVGTNNHYKNLIWGTPKMNAEMREYNHKVHNKKRRKSSASFKREKNPMYGTIRIGTYGLYNQNQLLGMIKDYNSGMSYKDLATKYGGTTKTIGKRIRDRKNILAKLSQIGINIS